MGEVNLYDLSSRVTVWGLSRRQSYEPEYGGHVIISDVKRRYSGCLLGGAVGDALGWPVEFSDLEEIFEEYGPAGIIDPVVGGKGVAEITDDTQMTLFTAEGLLRVWAGSRHFGAPPDFSAVRHSYLCWLITQGETGNQRPPAEAGPGWLLSVEGLHRRRAPGNTCLSALQNGMLDESGIANNTGKGCGGVMRAAPAGLIAVRIHGGEPAGAIRLAFEIGCATAALTHGHPSGYYPAGVLAAVIATIVTGGSLVQGCEASLGYLAGRKGAGETRDAVSNALELWCTPGLKPSPEVIASMGEGWVGEEALAIGLYCALAADGDFVKGVRLAVNHSGDSDSTGSITGNILGAALGEQAIPASWLCRLELSEVIRQVGEDLFTAFEGAAAWLKRYPPV